METNKTWPMINWHETVTLRDPQSDLAIDSIETEDQGKTRKVTFSGGECFWFNRDQEDGSCEDSVPEKYRLMNCGPATHFGSAHHSPAHGSRFHQSVSRTEDGSTALVSGPPNCVERPSDPQELSADQRKETPVWSGVMNYFPDAIMEIAHCSWVGNEQHNPGTPLHWDRSKSGDELDALARHLVRAGTLDSDGIRESTKVAWRALANLQKEIERDRAE